MVRLNQEEYIKESNRVEQYKQLSKQQEILEHAKYKIESGILTIICNYKEEIDFCKIDKDTRERIIRNLCETIDVEIADIRKQKKEI